MILADFENSWRNRINKRWWEIWWKQRTSVFEYSLNSIIKIGLYDFTDSTISKLVHYEFNCSWHRLNHTGWYRLKNALVWTCLNQLEPVIKINSELTGHFDIRAAKSHELIQGSSDPSHFIFEIHFKNRWMIRPWIRHRTTLKLNDEFLDRFKIDWRLKFRVVLMFYMSDPTLSDIDFKNKMASVCTTLM